MASARNHATGNARSRNGKQTKSAGGRGKNGKSVSNVKGRGVTFHMPLLPAIRSPRPCRACPASLPSASRHARPVRLSSVAIGRAGPGPPFRLGFGGLWLPGPPRVRLGARGTRPCSGWLPCRATVLDGLPRGGPLLGRGGCGGASRVKGMLRPPALIRARAVGGSAALPPPLAGLAPLRSASSPESAHRSRAEQPVGRRTGLPRSLSAFAQ